MNADRRPLVAFISDAEEFAGAEHYMVVLVESLSDRFDFVAVVGDNAADETSAKLTDAGATVIRLPNLVRRPAPKTSRRVLDVLREVSPDLWHINLSDQGDGIAPLLAARRAAPPVVATLHNVLPMRAWWREAISRRLLRGITETIAVSDRLGRYLERRGIRNVVVKNGLSAPELAPDARSLLGLPHDAFVVGGIGRLHHQKGWDILCHAAALVHESRDDIRFVVIGDGSERQSLASDAACGHVEFVGYRKDASNLLGAFDLVVIPSRYEGLGLVAIEGMLAGVPIVAADIEGLVEVTADCARIVPARQRRPLAEAILELADDSAGREEMAARAQNRAERLFTRERMIGETASVYSSLLQGRGTGGSAREALI